LRSERVIHPVNSSHKGVHRLVDPHRSTPINPVEVGEWGATGPGPPTLVPRYGLIFSVLNAVAVRTSEVVRQ
jgi:hypothetical protein